MFFDISYMYGEVKLNMHFCREQLFWNVWTAHVILNVPREFPRYLRHHSNTRYNVIVSLFTSSYYMQWYLKRRNGSFLSQSPHGWTFREKDWTYLINSVAIIISVPRNQFLMFGNFKFRSVHHSDPPNEGLSSPFRTRLFWWRDLLSIVWTEYTLPDIFVWIAILKL